MHSSPISDETAHQRLKQVGLKSGTTAKLLREHSIAHLNFARELLNP